MEHLMGNVGLRRPDSDHKLTLQQACQMLEELIKLYQAPEFQHQMSLVYVEHATEDDLEEVSEAAGMRRGSMVFDKSVIDRRRELCMPVQAQVIPRFGFEATQAGVLKSYAACCQPEIANAPEFLKLNYVIGLCVHFGPAQRALGTVRRRGYTYFRWQMLVRGAVVRRAFEEPATRRPPVRRVEAAGPRAERRQRILEALEVDGSLLECSSGCRRDHDAVLTAIGQRPGALRHACIELLFDLGFAHEAVRRNWRSLEFFPDTLRMDRRLVLAAGSRSSQALSLAHRVFRRDPDLPKEAQKAAKEAALGPARYEGECLRLAGYCCGWRRTDACLRFVPLPPEDEEGALVGGLAAPQPQASVTHRLTVHLQSGRLSFQIFSCTREANLRIYADEAGQDGFFRLPLGDREGSAAVVAPIGGRDDGRGQNFFVEAEAGETVSIYVELAVGAGVGDIVNVWCVSEGRKPPPWALQVASLWQDPDRQRPRYKLNGSDAYEAKIFENVEDTDKFHDLIRQAFSLHEQYVSGRFDINLITGGRRLTLLADAQGTTSMGYCLYTIAEKDCLWIQHLLVLEEFRRRGVGKALMRWASARASSSGCTCIRLKSNDTAMPFYKSVGFEVVAGKDELMELRVPVARGGYG